MIYKKGAKETCYFSNRILSFVCSSRYHLAKAMIMSLLTVYVCVLFPLGVGTAFSVTGLSCVNYTAEFSLNIDLLVVSLELSCNNGTNVRNTIHVQSSVYYQGAI